LTPGVVRVLAALLAGAPSLLSAAILQVDVDDGAAVVEFAMVSLHSDAAAAATRAGAGVMDQINSEFAPRVLAVSVGSTVSFPNRDNTRHHVYSFSPAKRFELPLYAGSEVDPVRFDMPGVVTLGCNIHDWMIGYIHVLDTPFHGVTDTQGRTRIELPAGRYELRVWHERLAPLAPAQARQIEVVEGEQGQQQVTLTLQPPPPPRGDDRLRALQEKFRSLKRD
jgi:plastocyanin